MTDFTGKVEAVVIFNFGSDLAIAAAPGDTTLAVSSIGDFSQLGGPLTVGTTTLAYTGIDNTVSPPRLLLSVPLASAQAVGVRVTPSTSHVEKRALVQADNALDADGVWVHLPITMDPIVRDGIRQISKRESITYFLNASGELEARNISSVDPTAIDETLIPTLAIALAQLETLNTITLPALNADLASLNADLLTLDGKFPIGTTDIQPNAITTPLLAANSVLASKILAGEIGTNHMVANTINGDRIAANTLAANRIIANSITSAQLYAQAIDGMTITGALIRTAASGQRITLGMAGALNQVNFYSGVAGEIFPGQITGAGTSWGGSAQGQLLLSSPYSGVYPQSYLSLMNGYGISQARLYGPYVDVNGSIISLTSDSGQDLSLGTQVTINGHQASGREIGNVVTYTDSGGDASFGFATSYSSTPLVIATGGNSEQVWVDPTGVTGLTFRARFRNPAGGIMASSPVRIYYLVIPVS